MASFPLGTDDCGPAVLSGRPLLETRRVLCWGHPPVTTEEESLVGQIFCSWCCRSAGFVRCRNLRASVLQGKEQPSAFKEVGGAWKRVSSCLLGHLDLGVCVWLGLLAVVILVNLKGPWNESSSCAAFPPELGTTTCCMLRQ